jgi:hypothetical protein
MTLGFSGLVAAYVVVASALVVLGLYSRWPWRLKATGIALTTAAQVGLYYSFPLLLGWPTELNLPRKFELLGMYMQEPDNITGARGDIFFWAIDKDVKADGRPRAYRVDFDPALKAVFQEAAGKLAKNMPQQGSLEAPDDSPMGIPWREGKGTGQKSVKVNFSDMPRGEGAAGKDTPPPTAPAPPAP